MDLYVPFFEKYTIHQATHLFEVKGLCATLNTEPEATLVK